MSEDTPKPTVQNGIVVNFDDAKRFEAAIELAKAMHALAASLGAASSAHIENINMKMNAVPGERDSAAIQFKSKKK